MLNPQRSRWSQKKILVVSVLGAPVGTAATLFLAYVAFIAGVFATWPTAKPEGALLLGGMAVASGAMAVVSLIFTVLCCREIAMLVRVYLKFGTCPIRGRLRPRA